MSIVTLNTYSAYVHGDATALRFGGTPVGLPTGAGYAVGNRMMDAYLSATGQRAADALLVETGEVLRVATEHFRGYAHNCDETDAGVTLMRITATETRG